MGFEKSGGAFFFNGGDFAHSTDIALLKPLNIDREPCHTVGFHSSEVSSDQKVGYNIGLIRWHSCSDVGFFAKTF
jgi:hypothetical protein